MKERELTTKEATASVWKGGGEQASVGVEEKRRAGRQAVSARKSRGREESSVPWKRVTHGMGDSWAEVRAGRWSVEEGWTVGDEARAGSRRRTVGDG